MKRRLKLFATGRMGLLLLAGMCAGGRVEAAAQTAESKAFSAARYDFSIHRWPQAETGFTNFLKKYPQSAYYAEAVLYEAQAIFFQARTNRLRSYDEVIQLLATEQSRATNRVDDFTYWTARALYWNTDYGQAASKFEELARSTNLDLRPEALYSEAHCYAQLKDWVRVVDRLQPPDGGFQRLVKADPTNEWVAQGLLLLGKAELTQKHYDGAEAALAEIPDQNLAAGLDWQLQDLRCRVKLESGHPEEALLNSTKLMAAAGDNAENKAKSILLIGDIYRDQEQFANALTTYFTNLYTTNLMPDKTIPEASRREALMNSVDVLNRILSRTDEAAQMLANYLAAYPLDYNSDFHRLMLGELRLKQAYEEPGGTNLVAARTNFEKIITDYPSSAYLGKAYLDLGWCLLAETNLPASQAAFSNAVANLPSSPNDQATARFKLADTKYQQGDFSGAIDNYRRILDDFAAFPMVTNNLFEPALYQMLRAGIATTNLTDARDALEKILKWFPNDFLGGRSLLLLGEAYNREGNAGMARDLFNKFKDLWPDSPLRSQADLAIARTYEREGKWTNAVQAYYGWIAGHTNSDALPLAEFSLAWAEFKASQETNAAVMATNAFRDFNNFATKYPSNELTAKAWYWMADYYRRLGGQFNDQKFYELAESNYQNVYLGWPGSDLYFRAEMEAGRTAVLRESPSAAVKYFTNLFHEPKCPAGLKLEAAFACGDAYSLAKDYVQATNWFLLVATTYTNDQAGIAAWGRVGDCCLQLGALAEANNATNSMNYYLAASNAYQMATNAGGGITTRSLAEYGLGQTLEKMARLKSGKERTDCLNSAVDCYMLVVNPGNLLAGEKPDRVAVREAGLAAGDLLEKLDRSDVAYQVYKKLRDFGLPPLKELQAELDTRMENIRKRLPPDKQ